MTIRMVMEPRRLRCTGAIEATLPNSDEGWGEVARVARERQLLPAEFDAATKEFVFRPALSPREAEIAWRRNVETQRSLEAAGLKQVHDARRALLRLGERVEGALPESLPDSPPPPQPEPPTPPAAPASRSIPTLPPEALEPLPVDPTPAPHVPDAQSIAIAAVMAHARDKREWYRLAVCMLALEGLDAALAVPGLPSAAAARIRLLDEAKALEQALRWAAETVR